MTTFECAQIATALATTIIALAAVAVAVYEGSKNRKHNRLSLKPALVLDTSTSNNPPSVSATVVNAGLGPAVIRKIQLFNHGEELVGDLEYELRSVISKMFEKFYVVQTTTSVMKTGYILRASSESLLLKITFTPDEPSNIEGIKELLNTIDVRVKYESFYGQPDVYDSTES